MGQPPSAKFREFKVVAKLLGINPIPYFFTVQILFMWIQACLYRASMSATILSGYQLEQRIVLGTIYLYTQGSLQLI
jgi:hypothetical protein